jgi:hypothetical protein
MEMSQRTVESLLRAIQNLPPREFDQLDVRLAQWKLDAASDEHLVRTTKQRLKPADDARLRKLIAKSEAGRLADREKVEYRGLARQAERINAERVKALAELVRRWAKPSQVVMQEVGWDNTSHGAIAE